MDDSPFASAPEPGWEHEDDRAVRPDAERIADDLIEFATSRDDSRYREMQSRHEATLPIYSRVYDSVHQFGQQARLLEHTGFPCVALGQLPLPIELPPWAMREARGRYRHASEVLDFRVLTALMRNHPVGLFSVSEATSFLRRRLAQFIAPTLRATASMPAAPSGPNFRVTTRTSGLRVHRSPAYFLQCQLVFGNTLSTPVDGYLDPGRYVFGVHDSESIRWDLDGVYRVPDHTEAMVDY